MTIDSANQPIEADPLPFARSYQLEALEIALKQNTIVFFETGTGKTLIAIMLLRSYAHLLRKPSFSVAVFLVPTVVLVNQQSEAVKTHTDLKVGKYFGDMGVDYWDAATWKNETAIQEVLVMTPQILLDALRHRSIKLNQIKVLIFDECHNARRKHQYACIMTEFYHRELENGSQLLPRVFGMTASPIKAKASTTSEAYWRQISELEKLMHSKVFTCESDSVLTQYIPFSTPKMKMYDHKDIPHETVDILLDRLQELVEKHKLSLGTSTISESRKKSAKEKLKKASSTFQFCLAELGIWLAMKAAKFYCHEGGNILSWGFPDKAGDRVIKAFSTDVFEAISAHIPSGPNWSICDDLTANMTAGYLTSKIICLVQTLLEYKKLKDLRCIVFVERIVTAIVIRDLLNVLLESDGWRTEYTAGNNSRIQSQSRKEQTAIVDAFRKGTVNIIVATSMLEEGLDVQSCNLVIRFDPSVTVCSFIQSRGRARMQNSDFVLMVRSDDDTAIARVKNYLASGDMMRKECLSHADVPCESFDNEMHGEPWYQVESTGAIVTLRSSVALLHFYCSRLPSDRYFKPYPRCTVDKELGTCTLYLPNSCPIRTVTVSGNTRTVKQLACLEACKKLHEVRALTDYLVPDIVEEEAEDQCDYEPYKSEHAKYFPRELVGARANDSDKLYHCYLIELQQDFNYGVKPQGILLAVHERLDDELKEFSFNLDVDKGKLIVNVSDVGYVTLSLEQVKVSQEFQVELLQLLLKNNQCKPNEENRRSTVLNYLLLPCLASNSEISVDWKCISSVLYEKNTSLDRHTDTCVRRYNRIHTKDGSVCYCMLENSLIRTPHNDFMYCIRGTLEGFSGTSYLALKDGEKITYKDYFRKNHGIDLQFKSQALLDAKRIFTVHNFLQRCRTPSTKEPTNSSCELPPELCSIVMSPIPISAIYSFSFLPSIMHRIESMLIASNLKSVPLMGHPTQTVVIPTLKVLEAITTKKCQENLHLESLETLGDSFLKYAASQQLFKTYQNRHEGLLSLKRERIICNVSLSRLGCHRQIPGFVRNEPFDLKTWMVPGTSSPNHALAEAELASSKKVYIGGNQNIKSKTVADVVEALIGAYLTAGGEIAALSFMRWVGINVDFVPMPSASPFVAKPEEYINVASLESLLRYKFQDASLLFEALTHGSYMRPEIPGCYQRLEFLGDAVLDYLITMHLYHTYHGALSPGLLTDLRSASVNNDCYAQSAIRAGLEKHILHLSPDLQRHIDQIMSSVEELPSVETFGWESETTLPKVLGDIIESIAGAIYIDSGCNKEKVFQSMKPLLEPLVTLETLKLHPKRELNQLCQKMRYDLRKPVVKRKNGMANVSVEVVAGDIVYRATQSASDRKMAEKMACKAVLQSLKEKMP